MKTAGNVVVRLLGILLLTAAGLKGWQLVTEPVERGGSALTVNDTTIDRFNVVVFAELESSVWMPGSNNYSRTHKEQSDWPKETAIFLQ